MLCLTAFATLHVFDNSSSRAMLARCSRDARKGLARRTCAFDWMIGYSLTSISLKSHTHTDSLSLSLSLTHTYTYTFHAHTRCLIRHGYWFLVFVCFFFLFFFFVCLFVFFPLISLFSIFVFYWFFFIFYFLATYVHLDLFFNYQHHKSRKHIYIYTDKLNKYIQNK